MELFSIRIQRTFQLVSTQIVSVQPPTVHIWVTLYTDVVDVVATTTGVNPVRKEVDMWPNFFTGFPFPSIGRANFNTLPTVAVTVGTENVTLELPNHAFRNRDYVGGFYISLRQAIPAGTTATLPILIGTNGDTRPLMAYNNEPVTVANLAGTGIYEIHYNKYTNELYLVNGGYRPTTAPAPTVETASLRSK